jgi:hypothetical protein
MVVINLNQYMFVNKLWILVPYSHWKTKNNVKLLLVDLYCTRNHVSTKNEPPFKVKKKLPWELSVIFLCEHCFHFYSCVPLNVWGNFVTFKSTLRRICHFAFPMQLQRGCLEILRFSNWGFLTSFLCWVTQHPHW